MQPKQVQRREAQASRKSGLDGGIGGGVGCDREADFSVKRRENHGKNWMQIGSGVHPALSQC